MYNRFLLDGAFARSAIPRDVGSQSAGHRSAAAAIGPSEMPAHAAPASVIGSMLDAAAAQTTAVHQDMSTATFRRSALKKYADACEWILFLVFFVSLMGFMLMYGFPFMAG